MHIHEKEPVVVIGFGWVGQANAIALKELGHPVFFFDPASPSLHYKETHPASYDGIEKIDSPLAKDSPATVYVVCVGDRVAPDGAQDISSIKKALETLKEAKGTVVLRSTILPDTLRALAFDFYVPEFLHEKKAIEESIVPHFFVVGASEKRREEPSFFAVWEERALRSFRGTPEEASHIKYLSNLWNAIRIAFVNEYGTTITAPSSPENVAKIEKITRFMFEDTPYRRYGRSFGGHCLPKDSRAYARFAKEAGKDTSLLYGMIDSNDAHQKLEARNPDLQTWFSEWERREGSGWVALRELMRSVKRNARRPMAALRRRVDALRTRDAQEEI